MKLKEKFYNSDRRMILNAICDMAEIQRGKSIFSDPGTGDAGYIFNGENLEHEYLFKVEESPEGCLIKLWTRDCEDDRIIDRAFFLLDYLLRETVSNIEEKCIEGGFLNG